MRDHVAIAKKAARTRKRMAEARDPPDRTDYYRARRVLAIKGAMRKLIEKAGYFQIEFASVMRHHQQRRAGK